VFGSLSVGRNDMQTGESQRESVRPTQDGEKQSRPSAPKVFLFEVIFRLTSGRVSSTLRK
jgi:hypothetical protein